MWSTGADSFASTEEGRAFLRSRVARFGLFAAGLFGVAALFRVVLAAIGSMYNELLHPSFVWHYVCILSFLLIWLLCRKPGCSARYVRYVEAGGIFAASLAAMMMGRSLPLMVRPDHIVIMSLSFGLIARAVYVPSSATRTAWLAIVIGMPLVAIQYLSYYNAGPEFDELAIISAESLDRPKAAFAMATMTTMWWTITTLVTWSASRVIYGLRRQVQKAERLGQYTLEEKLGEGGMGMVFKARHAMLRRPTAVKLLHPDRIGEVALGRFEREVQLTAQLSHPNTVTVYDYGRTPEGVFYYAMELLDGATLEEIVESDGRLPAARVIHVLDHIAGALSEAHGTGLIHRDIKPANIFLCEQGGEQDVAKILDFGLVKDLGVDEDANITQAGIVAGTPLYMSPESMRADDVDHRSDLYSLGCVGYYLLSGEPVFEGDSVIDICSKHLNEDPVPPSERISESLAVDLEAVIMSCLAKDPAARPASAWALREMLADCADAKGWDAEHARKWWEEHTEALSTPKVEVEADAGERMMPGATIVVDLDRTLR